MRKARPAEKEQMEEQLRGLRAERDRLRKILEAKKEGPPIRKPR